MKAVIPVAGAGTKLRPHTHTQPKPLIPVAGKPILGHIIESLLKVGITQQVFIVGYLKEKIQDYVESRYGEVIDAEFVIQEPRKGLAHAIWIAKEHIIGEEEILVILGDTLFGKDIKKILGIKGGVLGVQEVDDPRGFGVAVQDFDENITNLMKNLKSLKAILHWSDYIRLPG